MENHTFSRVTSTFGLEKFQPILSYCLGLLKFRDMNLQWFVYEDFYPNDKAF